MVDGPSVAGRVGELAAVSGNVSSSARLAGALLQVELLHARS